MTPHRVLVAGVGNIFFGDDAFGVAVARRLIDRAPSHVRVVDFGIRGRDLAYALLESYEFVVLVDTVRRGGAPGTVYIIDLAEEGTAAAADGADPHGLAPARAIELARQMGGTIPPLVLVGCEPAELGDAEQGDLGLSPPVSAAIEHAIEAIEALIAARAAPASPCTNLA